MVRLHELDPPHGRASPACFYPGRDSVSLTLPHSHLIHLSIPLDLEQLLIMSLVVRYRGFSQAEKKTEHTSNTYYIIHDGISFSFTLPQGGTLVIVSDVTMSNYPACPDSIHRFVFTAEYNNSLPCLLFSTSLVSEYHHGAKAHKLNPIVIRYMPTRTFPNPG